MECFTVNDAASEFMDTVRETSEQYTATLTHDLRGPISAAKAGAQLIMRAIDKPDLCLKNAKRIVENLGRMDRMIQDLLDADRIRAGLSLSLELEKCDPIAIASELVDEMVTVYGDRLKLLADGKIEAWWSRDLVRRSLENLVSNAAKYGDQRADITARIREAGTSVELTVHNEGSPISEDEQRTLFLKYRRSRSAEKSLVKGWGLGLTLVSGVVKAHHGSIKVESSVKGGTSFIMTLPKDCRGFVNGAEVKP